MLSYKDWKILNESLIPVTALGLKTLPTVGGVVGSHLPPTKRQLREEEAEQKKKMSLLGGGEEKAFPPAKDDEEPEEDSEEGGGGDEGDELDLKAKKPTSDDEGGDLDDLGGGEKSGGLSGKLGGGDEGEDLGDEGDEEDLGGDEDLGGGDEEGEETDGKDLAAALQGGGRPIEIKQCKTCTTAKMSKEDRNWWNSVNSMLDTSSVNKKNTSGLSEDMLIAMGLPATPDTQEPQPGEVGYAPQTRIGTF